MNHICTKHGNDNKPFCPVCVSDLEAERDALRAEVERLKSDGAGDARQIHGLQEKLDAALLQVRAFEEAKVKDLEALHDLLEAMAPFYLHAKALRSASILNVAPLKEISKCGSSYLVGGAFLSAIEAFEKWGEVSEAFIEKRNEPSPICGSCGWNNGPDYGGGIRAMYTVGKVSTCGECIPKAR